MKPYNLVPRAFPIEISRPSQFQWEKPWERGWKPYPVFLFSLPSDYLASSIRGKLICCFEVTFCDFYTKPAYFVIPINLKEAKILNISSIDNKNRRVPVLFDLKLCMQ